MALDASARRRWFGAVVLTVALGMVVCGETLLKGRMGDFVFLLYWLACFLLTGLAVLIAFADARALRQRIRDEQRALFDSTLKKIESEANRKPRGRGPRARPK